MNVMQPKNKKNNLLIIILASVILIIGAIICALMLAGGNQGYRTVSVVDVSGKVAVVKNGVEYNAYPGMLLQEGHEIVTSGDSFVRLVLDEDKYVKLESGSKLIFETLGTLGSGKTKLCLERGSLTTELTRPLKDDDEYVVNTPNAVLAVRGTFFRVDLESGENGDIIANVMTYGGRVSSQRILPTGTVVEEEVMIEAGYKTCINMSKEYTRYVVETTEQGTQFIDPSGNEDADVLSQKCTMPIVINEISNDDLVDIFFSGQNGHELFVKPEELTKDIIDRGITLEEKTSVYQKAKDISAELENIVIDDSHPIPSEEPSEEDKPEEDVQTQDALTDGSMHVHEEMTEEIAATCTETGKVTVTCRACKEILEETEIPALGHNYGEWMMTQEATCTTSGTRSRSCEDCGFTEMEMVEATGHEFGAWTVMVQAKCDSVGSRKHTCAACGTEETEVVFALAHSYANEFTVDKAATCITVGSKSKHCVREGCDKVSEITEIPVTGHSYGDWTVTKNSTCITTGTKERSCSVCGKKESEIIPLSDHDYGEWKVTVEADCENTGSQKRICSVCKQEESETIAALGHSYASKFTVDTEATCTTVGSKSKHCERDGCDSTSEVTEIAALGHSYGEWAETLAATCIATGTKERSCGTCGETEEETIALTDHNYGAWTIITEADCENAGSRKHTCGVCGNEESETIAALGHSYATEFTEDVAATCTTAGSKSRHCVRGCGSSTEPTEILATGHDFTDWQEIQAATCIATGTKERSCNTCGEMEEETIALTNHSYGAWTVTAEADCENAGSRKHTCGVCGNEESETIAALGHSYASEFTIDTPATCTTVGSKSKHCERTGCGSTSEVTEIEALGHSYGASTVTQEATCTVAGTQEKVCSACGDIVEETITALGHSYASEFTIDTPATCTTVGSKSKHCERTGCGSTSEVTEIEALGHSYGASTVTQEATCTVAGTQEKECSVCGDIVEETIAALGHSYASEFTIDTPATCTTVGSKSKHCERTGCGSTSEVTEIAATGHLDENSDNLCDSCGETFVEINTTNFPDATFMTFVESYDTDNDGGLFVTELEQVTTMSLDGTEVVDGGYSDLTGIEHFTELTDLSCSYNTGLTSLDVRGAESLSVLDISGTSIPDANAITMHDSAMITELSINNTNIDFEVGDIAPWLGNLEIFRANYAGISADEWNNVISTALPMFLKELYISGNDSATNASEYLSGTIDLSWFTSLEQFEGMYNAEVTGFTLDAKTTLEELNIAGSGIQELSLADYSVLSNLTLQDTTAACTGLNLLDITNCTSLTSLDVNACSSLTNLDATNCTSLTSLDVSGCSDLSYLTVTNCTLMTSLNALGCNGLLELAATDCEVLTQLDIGGCTGLKLLAVGGTLLSSLDVAGYTELEDLTVSYCTALTELNANGCSKLTYLDNYSCDNMEKLYIDNSIIESIHFSNSPNLKEISARYANLDDNEMGEIANEATPQLEYLDVEGNQLSVISFNGDTSNLKYLNMANNTALTALYLSDKCSVLEELNLSGTAITSFVAGANVSSDTPITTLNLADCTSLTEVDMSDCTSLTTLNLNNCTSLQNLYVRGCTSLSNLDASACPALVTLEATNSSSLASLNVSGCSELTNLTATNCSSLTSVNAEDCSALMYLDLDYGDVSEELNITGCTALKGLGLSYTAIKSVDVAGYTNLEFLCVSSCEELTTLNVSGCGSLTQLQNISCNSLTSINISDTDITEFYNVYFDSPVLQTITAKNAYIDDSDLTMITDQITAQLQTLDLEGNQITSISFDDASRVSGLKTLNLANNASLTSVDVTNCTALEELNLSGTGVTSFAVSTNISNSTPLITLNLADCASLTEVNMSGCTTLTSLDITNCTNLTDLDLSDCTSFAVEDASLVSTCTALENLDISGCTSLDWNLSFDSSYTALQTVDVSGSGIVALVVENPSLHTLNVSNTPMVQMYINSAPSLSSLVLENMPDMNQISISNGGFTTITVNECTFSGDSSGILLEATSALTTLEITNSVIPHFEAYYCTNLEVFDASGSEIDEVEFYGSSAIKRYIIDDSNISTLVLGGTTTLEEFSAKNCSQVTSWSFNGYSALKTIDVSGSSALTSLDLTNCTALTSIDVTGVNGSDTAAAELTVTITGTSLTEANFTKSPNLTLNLVTN